jgi:methylmalonyl-CoA mutase C-terminal domain/subunit
MDNLDNRRNSKKILLAKLGLDGHDKGVKIVIHYLKNSGYQIIYSGIHKTPRQILDMGVQEDVDAIGISILSGSHIEHISELGKLMKHSTIEKVPLFIGGIIGKKDEMKLNQLGVRKIFNSGVPMVEIIKWVDSELL